MSPAAGEAEQPAAEYLAREVFLRDRKFAACPTVPDGGVGTRQHDVAERGVDGELGEDGVQLPLGGRLVHGHQDGGLLHGSCWLGAGAGGGGGWLGHS